MRGSKLTAWQIPFVMANGANEPVPENSKVPQAQKQLTDATRAALIAIGADVDAGALQISVSPGSSAMPTQLPQPMHKPERTMSCGLSASGISFLYVGITSDQRLIQVGLRRMPEVTDSVEDFGFQRPA